jgi:hypothetical protein
LNEDGVRVDAGGEQVESIDPARVGHREVVGDVMAVKQSAIPSLTLVFAYPPVDIVGTGKRQGGLQRLRPDFVGGALPALLPATPPPLPKGALHPATA